MLSRFVAGPGRGGGGGARSRLPLCLGPFHFSVVYSAARFSPPVGDRASLTFAFRETCSPPDSFSRLIGSFQAIYGASQGDRVISFGLENGHDLYRVRRIFAGLATTMKRRNAAIHNFWKNCCEGILIGIRNICVTIFKNFYPK